MFNKLNISLGKQKLIVYIVLTLATLAVLGQVTQFDFINFDDPVYVTQNSYIQSGITLKGFLWAFTTKYFGLWNPMIWISFMFDYQLYGLNPGGYHLTNFILHIMSALMLFWLFNRMTGTVWKSAFVAAFFALHPLHVESVAWVSERKDVLSAFFWMVTLCMYVYYTEKPVIKRYLLVVFGFAYALMSKPMVVTLPVIMILLDYWPLNRFQSQKGNLIWWQLKEKIPFFILSAVLVIITLYSPNPDATVSGNVFPLSARLANAPVAFVTYLEKTFWPHSMTIFYPFSDKLPLGQVWGATLLIIIISVAVILMVKRLPYLFVGWFWYAITIAPVIGIIQISLTAPYAMADRYHYLPSIGIAAGLAWGIPSLIERRDTLKKILFPAVVISVAILALISWQQCGYWKNSISLFSHALRVTNKNYLAYNNRGASYEKFGQYQRAFKDYNEAIRLKPDYAAAYYNRGTIYGKFGHDQNAIDDLSKAIRLKSDYAAAYNNLGITYLNQGNNELACSNAQKACAMGICNALEMAKNKGYCR